MVRAGDCNNVQAPSPAVAIAIRFTCDQLGEPYVWGGNGELGWDCSGLVKAAYFATRIDIPVIPGLLYFLFQAVQNNVGELNATEQLAALNGAVA